MSHKTRDVVLNAIHTLHEKLSDEFGQYLIVLSCAGGHVRQAYPKTLAAISGP